MPSSREKVNSGAPVSVPRLYGRLRAALKKKGQSIGSMDLLIAAHAVSLDVRLVTHHVRGFGRVPGLKIENWV